MKYVSQGFIVFRNHHKLCKVISYNSKTVTTAHVDITGVCIMTKRKEKEKLNTWWQIKTEQQVTLKQSNRLLSVTQLVLRYSN